MHALVNQLSDADLAELYGPTPNEITQARQRLEDLITLFEKDAGEEPTSLYTAAGRTEMGGNHTDHQHGNVLAASVNLDSVAAAAKNDQGVVRVISAQYPADVVKVGDWAPRPEEEGKSIALVRGICGALAERGYDIGGATIATHSNVPGGSGLSSSAAFEVLIARVLNHLFCDDELGSVELAQIGQYAENVYFGKPSGLLDQMASSVGGVISVDFGDPDHPVVERIDFSMPESGHVLCIIDSGADHADLTDDYSAITEEMGAVARYFDQPHLREVAPEEFWADLAGARAAAGDRAVLRAIHFFNEDKRVPEQSKALAEGHFDEFLQHVKDSGHSSATLLQNIYSDSAPTQQAVGLSVALAEQLLAGRGAVRVHGGGFAGTVQAYVPQDEAEDFKTAVDAVLGEGACAIVRIRRTGGAVIAG